MVGEKTLLNNVILFKRQYSEDHRGTYEPLYVKDIYTESIKEHTGDIVEFMEDDFATSSKHVLRGIHGDDRTWKLVTCLYGSYYIVVVNCDPNSDKFGQWQNFTLSDTNKYQLLIPPFHGHAYVVMSDKAIFHYKQSCIYQGMNKQFTYKYDDSRFNIWWPIKNPIVSERDDRGFVK